MKGICGCGKATRIGQRYCNGCHAAYSRNHRLKHRDLPTEAKKKAIVRSVLRVYISRGKVKKETCLYCGDIKVEAHHPNYDKPLDVIWMCRKHHVEHHKKVSKSYKN